jgi:uncharacterized protein (TIGR02246 family)
MKPNVRLSTGIALAVLAHTGLRAEEPAPEIAGLEKAAEEFVIAYNNKDAAALAALFTEQGELVDLNAEEVITGRGDIEAHYKERFAEDEVPSVAVEVDSVRIVAPKTAVEDGKLHFTPPGDDEPARSVTYTAVLSQSEAGAWQVASTRTLTDVTSQEGHLADLLDSLKGDWTGQRDGLRLDLAFGWDESGKFISGEMLAATSDGKPVETSIRLGWDGAKKSVTGWTYDSGGGTGHSVWTPDDDRWTVRTEGTTADGETMSANQHLTFEDDNTFIWTSSDRIVDGETLPDTELRIVRRAPEPAGDDDSATAAGPDGE